jgi:hypothetical protein
MQDYNYWKVGCLEVTIELTCCKYPAASTLNQLWSDNKNALIEFMKLANTGVKGTVKFFNNQPAARLSIQINSINPIFKVSDDSGEYYRILEAGTYNISVLFDCTLLHQEKLVISSNAVATVKNIVLNETLYNYYTANSNKLNKYAKFCDAIYNGYQTSNSASTNLGSSTGSAPASSSQVNENIGSKPGTQLFSDATIFITNHKGLISSIFATLFFTSFLLY